MLAWFGGYLDNEPLSAIDRDTIEDLREGLREEGAGGSTVNRYMALLRAILRKARDEWRYIDNIPKVPMYDEDAAEPRWLRNDEFERLKRELPPHLKLAAEFAVLTYALDASAHVGPCRSRRPPRMGATDTDEGWPQFRVSALLSRSRGTRALPEVASDRQSRIPIRGGARR